MYETSRLLSILFGNSCIIFCFPRIDLNNLIPFLKPSFVKNTINLVVEVNLDVVVFVVFVVFVVVIAVVVVTVVNFVAVVAVTVVVAVVVINLNGWCIGQILPVALN